MIKRDIFKKAQKELTFDEMGNWVFFAYGVMFSGIEQMAQEEVRIFDNKEHKRMIEATLLKGIQQEISARKSNIKLIRKGG